MHITDHMELAGMRLGAGPRLIVGAMEGKLMVGGAGGSPSEDESSCVVTGNSDTCDRGATGLFIVLGSCC